MRLALLLLCLACAPAGAVETKVLKDITYKDDVVSLTPY